MSHNRTDVVYDMYSHLYWEPQKIDCIRRGDKKFTNEEWMIDNLKKLEVPLNHIMNIFFTCLNTQSTQRFFERSLDKPNMSDDYDLYVRNLSQVVDIDKVFNPTQPDLFFVWDSHVISLEMKVSSKSDCQQILKYAFLHSAEQKKSLIKKKHHLLLLGKWEFSNFWKDTYNSPEEVKANCLKDIDNLSDKYKRYSKDIIQMLNNLMIHYISYEDLALYLWQQQKIIKDKKEYKLFEWLVQELLERKLVRH